MIYTSYLSNVKNLPKDVVPIAICGGQITGWKYPRYSKLAPKWKFFSEWKKTHDNDYYIEHFNAEVLSVLNQRQVVEDLMRLSENKDVALICYERPEAFCHRHLVADWLRKAGYEVEEYSTARYTTATTLVVFTKAMMGVGIYAKSQLLKLWRIQKAVWYIAEVSAH